MKDRNGVELQLDDHVAYYRIKDGKPSGHVGTVVQIKDIVGKVYVRLDVGSKDYDNSRNHNHTIAATRSSETLLIDRPREGQPEVAKPAAHPHVMGLDPEQISWAEHRAFFAERR